MKRVFRVRRAGSALRGASLPLLVGLAFALVGCGTPKDTEPPPALPLEHPEPEPTGFVESIPETVVKSLLFGFSYEECVAILGREEDEFERDYDPGTGEYGQPSLTIWRIWRFEDGSALRLGFQADQLRDKAFVPPGAEEDNAEGESADYSSP